MTIIKKTFQRIPFSEKNYNSITIMISHQIIFISQSVFVQDVWYIFSILSNILSRKHYVVQISRTRERVLYGISV